VEARLAALLVRHRLAFVALSLVTIAAVSYGARFVWFNGDYRIFFRADNPQLVAHEQQQASFTKSDNVSFILAPRDGEVFTRGVLEAMSFDRGVRTRNGVVPGRTTAAGMVRRYRQSGFRASARYDAAFQGTFVTVRRRSGTQVIGGFAQRGEPVGVLGIPFVPLCE